MNTGRAGHVCGSLQDGTPFIAGGRGGRFQNDVIKNGGVEIFNTDYGFWDFADHQLPVEEVRNGFLLYDDIGDVYIAGGRESAEVATVLKLSNEGWRVMDWTLPRPQSTYKESYTPIPGITNYNC